MFTEMWTHVSAVLECHRLGVLLSVKFVPFELVRNVRNWIEFCIMRGTYSVSNSNLYVLHPVSEIKKPESVEFNVVEVVWHLYFQIYNMQINTICQSITQLLFYIQWYIYICRIIYIYIYIFYFFYDIIKSEHKVFPWLQTFITRKLRGIQTYFFTII